VKTLALMAVLVGWRYHVEIMPGPCESELGAQLVCPHKEEIWIKVTRQDVCVLFGSPYYQRIKC